MLTAARHEGSPDWQRFAGLTAGVDAALDDPGRRLALAGDLFALAAGCGPDARLRLTALEDAARLDPFKASYRLALGQVKAGLGLTQDAIADYRLALELWPDSTEAHLLLGEAFVAAGELKEARSCLQRARDGATGRTRALLTRAELGLIECDLREASGKAAWLAVLEKLSSVDLGSAAVTLAFPPGLVGEPVVLGSRAGDPAGTAAGPESTPPQPPQGAAEERKPRRRRGRDGGRSAAAASAKDAHLPGCVYSAAASFCEKCLKVVLECDDAEVVGSAVRTAAERMSSIAPDHPALRLLVRAADDPRGYLQGKGRPDLADDQLLGLVLAHRLARSMAVGADEGDARVRDLIEWRTLVERDTDTWPALRDAYVYQVGEWASRAYKDRQLELAATLWGEAERLAAHDPRVLQNLALVHTRMKDERAYEWYWDKTTRALTLYGEMMPEADSYASALTRKHGAFVAGARDRLAALATNEERLELGAIWIREAVPHLAYRQLAFANPMFRCGVMVDDYVGDQERAEAIREASSSIERWLELAATWQELGETSALVQWRRASLRDAVAQASDGGPVAFHSYDHEKDAFAKHREAVLGQYLALFFRVLLPAAEDLDLRDEMASNRYALIARGLMTFPHRLLKPGVMKAVPQIEAEADLLTIVRNYAIGPWFNKAREYLERQQWQEALGYLESANSIAPGAVVVLFHMAFCQLRLDRWDAADGTAREAMKLCGPNDEEARTQLNLMLEQLPLARASAQIDLAQKAMEREQWSEAAAILDRVIASAPGLIPALFYRAVCHLRLEEWDKAEKVARSTLKRCKESDEAAREQLGVMLEQIPKAMEAAALNPIVSALKGENWLRAIREADTYLAKHPRSAVALFYKGIAQMHSKSPKEAHATATKGLDCITDDTPWEIASQLHQLLEASDVPPWIEHMNQAVEAMNREQWHKAMTHLDAVLSTNPKNAQACFYRGLARFRSAMEQIKESGGVASWRVKSFISEFEEAQKDADAASRLAGRSDKDLKEAIGTLQQNIKSAIGQLKKLK